MTSSVLDMRIADCTTFVIANPPPHFGGRYFIVVKLTTDTGIVAMSEDLNRVTLAVNIDLDGSSGGPDTVSNVDFAFVPPLELTTSWPSRPTMATTSTRPCCCGSTPRP